MIYHILWYAIHILYIVVVMPCIHYILIYYILILYVVVGEYVTTTYSPQTKLINSVN